MNVIIDFNCDNEAFSESESYEVSRILKELANKIESRQNLSSHDNEIIRDINGNEIGRIFVSEED